ncbi:uncharacterized protein LAESUDRAFT_683536 [Laetiporus sulphureus 93-53]|uniref:Heterokaryon incompatibility domain-containing protein n=1 Tax=Laetiporus sulphureus 93-53 TaxID=1314785 RepID=A0A165CXN9_9APHY|nr:uncharacterized protein LAESUDRAFT_683536 [Laetiporus sulphureus 93-53]KZT03685.1 hypothetical protein LAESUDRAFT_683536 [Laetiporus sulphureus 93-53]
MGYQYLWIDRLCIIQDDRHDKKLQIRNMHAVYKHCAICFVLPGGIQRIVGLNEETGWITRAWTLQEAIAPARTYVVYDRWDSRYRWSGETAQEVFPDGSFRYSMAPLADILASSIPLKGYSGYRPAIIRSTEGDLEASASARVQLVALWGAMKLKGAAKEQAIWRSALMRTSSRPVDMVYSIMGLFDVTLDTHAYGEDDRLLASRAVAQATLQKGCAPNWLGTSFFLPPSRKLSAFPRVPETSVVNDLVQIGYTLPDGRWREVAAMMNNFGDAQWWLVEMPSPTTIDDAGFLHFSSYAISAAFVCGGREFTPDFDNLHVADDGPSYVLATDGTIWAISDSPADLLDQRSTFMVFIGRQYPWDESAWAGDCTVRAVIVEEHSVGKCQILGWCWLGDVFMEWIKASWRAQSFRIGGPE